MEYRFRLSETHKINIQLSDEKNSLSTSYFLLSLSNNFVDFITLIIHKRPSVSEFWMNGNGIGVDTSILINKYTLDKMSIFIKSSPIYTGSGRPV